MELLERELQQLIMETPNEKLWERGLQLTGEKRSEVNLGNYGRADIICADIKREKGAATFNIYVLELKKGMITVDAVVQVSRYFTKIENYLSQRFPNSEIKVFPILIGSDFTNDVGFIHGHSFMSLILYSFDSNGLHFRWIRNINWED